MKTVCIKFDYDDQLFLDFGDNIGSVVYSEPFDNEKSKEKYEKDLKKTIGNIIRMLSSVS